MMKPRKYPGSETLVWEMYKNLTEQSQHFNNIESTYRTLASTWLLAAFAGIGFILKDLRSESPEFFIAAVAGAAASSVVLYRVVHASFRHSVGGLGAGCRANLELCRTTPEHDRGLRPVWRSRGALHAFISNFPDERARGVRGTQ